MGLFNFGKKKDVAELDSDLEKIKLENEIMTHEAEIAEKESIIKELKQKYGRNWMQILGVSKLTDLSTLRSFLKSAKQGMEASTSTKKLNLNPANFKGIRKA